MGPASSFSKMSVIPAVDAPMAENGAVRPPPGQGLARHRHRKKGARRFRYRCLKETGRRWPQPGVGLDLHHVHPFGTEGPLGKITSSAASLGFRNPASSSRSGIRVPNCRLPIANSEIVRSFVSGRVLGAPDSGQIPIDGKPAAQPFLGRITSAEPTVATFSFWLVPVRSRITDPVASSFAVTVARYVTRSP